MISPITAEITNKMAEYMQKQMDSWALDCLYGGIAHGAADWYNQDPLTLDKIKDSVLAVKRIPVHQFYKIIPNPSMTEQYRFPKSKKRRIRSKWAKQDRNFRPSDKCLVDSQNGNVYCHQIMAVKLQHALRFNSLTF